MVLTAAIIIAATLSIIISVSWFSERFRSHLIKKWPDITVSLLLVLLGSSIAITGIYWTLQHQSDSFHNNQLDIFKRSFPAVTEETAGNQALIKSLKKSLGPTTLDVRRIQTSISESLYTNPLLYKYVGQEFLYALGVYLERARSTNATLDLAANELRQKKKISGNAIAGIQQNLDALLYYLYIFQYQSQYYIFAYGDEGQFRPGNQQQIMRWLLKEEDISIEGILRKLDELSNISPEKKEEIRRSTRETWKKVRRKHQ